MQSAFSRKFNELTGDKYSYVKLTRVDFFVKTQSIELSLIYPMEKREEVDENIKEIRKAISTVIGTKAKLVINIKAACFDLDYCKQLLGEFFKAYPSVAPFISASEISSETNDNNVKVNIPLESDACDYCIERHVKDEAEDFLETYFTEKISVNFVKTEQKNTGINLTAYADNSPKYYMSMEGGRLITPESVTEFIGKPITDPAMYIEDCNSSCAETTVV